MGITYCSQSDGVVTCATDQTLEAMFPEHWERGTGTWNVEHRFVKSWYEGVYLFRMFQSEMEHVPSVMGTMFPEHCFGTRNVFKII